MSINGERSAFAKGLILGTVVGSAIAAVAALLYAPKSGKELRGDLKETTRDLLTRAEGLVDKAGVRASDALHHAHEKLGGGELPTDATNPDPSSHQ